MASSRTPGVAGWGGAGDGCVAVDDALRLVGVVEDALRGALPEQWQSAAADECTARLGELLLHAALLEDLVRTARLRATELSAAVEAAWSEP